MKRTENFLMTSDKELAEKLKASGFVEVENNDDRYVFFNCNNIKFDFADNEKIVFTNKLCI